MVSVIIPVYNVENYLNACVDSILNQTLTNLECLLIDDGSTDASGELCDRYLLRDSRVKVIHQQNSGSGPARNRGMKEAKGTYVYFSDADDVADASLLERVVQRAETMDSDVVLFGYTDAWTDSSGQRHHATNSPPLFHVSSPQAFRERFSIVYQCSYRNIWNKLYRAQFIKDHQISFKDQKIGQDALFNLDVFRSLARFSTLTTPLYHYTHRTGSAVHHYNPKRFEVELVIANQFEDLMSHWDLTHVYSTLIQKEFTAPVQVEIINLTMAGKQISEQEKIERIQMIMDLEKIKAAVKSRSWRETKNVYLKGLFLLLHFGKYKSALQMAVQKTHLKDQFVAFYIWMVERVHSVS